MTKQHTPGPWSSDHEYEETWDTQTNIYVGVKNILIAQVCETDGNISNEELEANARLIAAAPDLLNALKQCCNAIQGGQPLESYGNRGAGYQQQFGVAFVEYLNTVIAKATG